MPDMIFNTQSTTHKQTFEPIPILRTQIKATIFVKTTNKGAKKWEKEEASMTENLS
jgi:hypothetical protein